MRLLFGRLAGPLATAGTPGACAFGRLLVALDGTFLDVPYTPANVAAFGVPPSGPHGAGAFPQVRVVTLAACGTHGVIDAVFRGRRAARSSEQDLARKIAARGRLRRGMLVIADRNFCGYPVVACLAATGADVLIRAKSSQRLLVEHALADGSCQSALPRPAAARARHTRNAMRRARGSKLGPGTGSVPGLPVRVIEADITLTPASGPPRTQRYRLITTLTDPAQAPAAQLAACYAQRWEIETSYREIKVFTRGPRVLRSQNPAGVTQEIWALLCACQLTSTARAHAAASAGLDPDRISYTVTLRAIRRALTTTTTTASTIAAEALSHLLPPRRHRSYPRLALTSTAKRRTARASLTSGTTHKITIMGPSPDMPGP